MTNKLGPFIKSLRRKHTFSQAFLAEKLGIARSSYIAVENGSRELSLEEAHRFVQLFGITIEELSSTVTPNYEKYKQMVLAFLRVGADSRGKVPKTKLAKLLYLADFAWFYRNLQSMSDMQYRRIQYGPVPDLYFRALDELFESGKIDIEKKDEALLISQAGSAPNAPIDLLSAEEQKLISDVATKWRGKRTQEIVDFTHEQLPYQICAENELIPYELIIQEDPNNVY